SIADVYDAMTSARVYRGPLCPFKALDMFVSAGLQKYETNAILTFIRNIVTTYLGNRVRLSNGMEGEIIYINQHNLARPTIKCGNCYVDLAQDMSISIEAII
ncbi:MAG: HD-GYP domain-containing protein, partial [Lachnospiraceae bacterium]|nr:HD-GYP domain-containing protein [Lachnospiraceae bacterium]